MQRAPQLHVRAPATAPRAAVLVLHGGTPSSVEPTTTLSASWLRMRLLVHDIEERLLPEGLAIWLVRFGVRGWNASAPGGPSPVADARAVLQRLRSTHPQLPIALLGHSMGARTAVAVAAEPGVRGVVALAPWWPAGEPVEALTGRRLIAIHTRTDVITSFAQTEAFVARARRVAEHARLVELPGLEHYLLRGRSAWNDEAVAGVLEVLA